MKSFHTQVIKDEIEKKLKIEGVKLIKENNEIFIKFPLYNYLKKYLCVETHYKIIGGLDDNKRNKKQEINI